MHLKRKMNPICDEQQFFTSVMYTYVIILSYIKSVISVYLNRRRYTVFIRVLSAFDR